MKAVWLDASVKDGTALVGSPLEAATLREEGIPYERLDVDETRYRDPIDALKRTRGYIEEDIVELHPEMENLEAVCRKFVDEHLHDEDEVRFVLEGEGIFDIRSRDDRWMRVLVEKGDLIVVPEQRHHRFRLTDINRIRCVRLFKDASGWVPHYRHAAE